MPYVSDPALNKYAINATQYPKVTALLAGFMRGYRIQVTYFRQCQQGNSNNRTNIADYATERNALTSEYERIFNFEMTLREKLTWNYNSGNASGSVTGQALFYAGVEPTVGDMFLYSVGDGKYGLFRVNLVESMNWTNDRVFLVSFSIQSVPDSSDMDGIVGPVVRDLVWTKMASYGQCYSVISATAYLLLEKIKVFRRELCRYYHRVFYDHVLNAYVRPDRIYDPCCVRFMLSKMTMIDVPVRSKQPYLLDNLVYDGSLWARLNDRYTSTLEGISPFYEYKTVTADSLCTYVNELYNHTVILPQKYVPYQGTAVPVVAPSPTTPPCGPTAIEVGSDDDTSGTNYYVLSQAFWTGDTTNMTNLEQIVYTVITTRTVDQTADAISEIMLGIYDVPVSDQYYFIPLYLHLIDLLMQYVPKDLDSPRAW